MSLPRRYPLTHRDTRRGEPVHLLGPPVPAVEQPGFHEPQPSVLLRQPQPPRPVAVWLAALYTDGKLRPLHPRDCEPIEGAA